MQANVIQNHVQLPPGVRAAIIPANRGHQQVYSGSQQLTVRPALPPSSVLSTNSVKSVKYEFICFGVN